MLLVAAACGGDPTRDRAEAALGPEAPGEAPGPSHRAGQPCTTCHRTDGPARPFVVAGTVFARPGSREGADGVVVELSDRVGTRRQITTNAAGSFFLGTDDWQPSWPIAVRLVANGAERAMKTAIPREGSCAKCHVDPRGPASAGALYAETLFTEGPP